MENNLLQAQEKIEHADYLCYMIYNNAEMLSSLCEDQRVGMNELAESAMSTAMYLISDMQKSIEEAIEFILAERRAQEKIPQENMTAAEWLKGGKGGAA